MFEIKQGDDRQLAAIRKLSELSGGVTKFLGVTSEVITLATARQMMDAGVADVVPLGSVSPSIQHAQALTPLAEETQAKRGVEMGNGMIIGVAQTRGGIGASTFVLNLATLLAQPPKRTRANKSPEAPRVAVVDLDLQNGTLGASIDIIAQPALGEMLRNGSLADGDFLKEALVTHKAGFDVLAAPADYVPLDAMKVEMMATLLDELRMAYDFVVLDMPRAMVDWLEPVLARADQMFLLSDTAVHSVRQARRMIDFYREEHVALPVDVLVSLERKSFGTNPAIKEAEKFLEQKLLHWLPRDDSAAQAAVNRGEPLLFAKPRSAIAKSLAKLIPDLKDYQASDKRRRA